MPKKLTQKEQGAAVAASLMQEMRFLGKLKEHKNSSDLIDIPERDSLSFQVVNGNIAAKSDTALNILGVASGGLHFCVADGRVSDKAEFDADHVVAFAHIHSKQENLLAHLNSNSEFRDGFLGFTGIINSKKIDDYFGVDPKNNTVKGRRLFYKLCYNDIDNLLLLCHFCNNHKSCEEALSWFERCEPYLGKNFTESVKKDGGLHEGIIIMKVCKINDKQSVRIGSIDCVLYEGDGHGLGTYINKWFAENHKGFAEYMLGGYASIWLEFKKMSERLLLPKDESAAKIMINVKKVLANVLRGIKRRYPQHFDSTCAPQLVSSSQNSSRVDTKSEEKARSDGLMQVIISEWRYWHMIKKLLDTIAKYDISLINGESKAKFFSIMSECKINTLEESMQNRFFDEISQIVEEKYKAADGKKPTCDDLLIEFREIANSKYCLSVVTRTLQHVTEQFEHVTERMAENQRQAADEIASKEAAKVAAEKDKEVAEKKAAEETTARLAAEKKVAELEAELAAYRSAGEPKSKIPRMENSEKERAPSPRP